MHRLKAADLATQAYQEYLRLSLHPPEDGYTSEDADQLTADFQAVVEVRMHVCVKTVKYVPVVGHFTTASAHPNPRTFGMTSSVLVLVEEFLIRFRFHLSGDMLQFELRFFVNGSSFECQNFIQKSILFKVQIISSTPKYLVVSLAPDYEFSISLTT